MKKVFFATPLVFLLGACGAPSVETLMENPDQLEKVSVDCMEKAAQGRDANTEACNNAAEAQSRLGENMMRHLLR